MLDPRKKCDIVVIRRFKKRVKQVAKLNIIPAQSLGFFFLNSNDTNFLIPLFSLISKELRCFMVDIKFTNAARLSS